MEACIYRNVALLIGVGVSSALLSSNVEQIRRVTQTHVFSIITMAVLLIGMIGLPAARGSSRGMMAVIYIGTMMALMSISATSTQRVVIKALLATFVTFVVMALVGRYTSHNLGTWMRFLMPALIAVIVLRLSNMFIRSSLGENMIAFASCLLFSFFVMHDANKFGRFCQGDDCCSQGTAALWLDFVNLFSSFASLGSS